MDVLLTPDAMRAWSMHHRRLGARVAVVPTMGALHDGHLELVRQARVEADVVVVTIFVNPLQFNQAADLAAYPRPIDDDLSMCRAAHVDAVYAPTAATMYPAGFETHVEPGALAGKLEGPMRPGHFRGVTTVVTKLFAATVPDVAVFGRKDYQQLAIVRRMVTDLDLGIEIVGVPTVREHDGLARSSRNTRLDTADRRAAVAIPEGLAAAAGLFELGDRDADRLRAACAAVIDREQRARLEYVELVDPDTLDPVDPARPGSVMLVAVWFGEVRLIDNRTLG